MERPTTITSLPRPIRKVALTCDLFRFNLGPPHYRHEQAANLRWLCAILDALTAWREWGLEVHLIEPPQSRAELDKRVASPRVLADYESDPLVAWAQRYDGDEVDVHTGFVSELEGVDLVVGFELPPVMKRVIHAQGVRYISFHIHALRFLPDLCLGAVTNDSGLLALLECEALPAARVELRARQLMAQMSTRAYAALHIPDDWPLLIAQTARDSILIERGRFADWPDFEDRMAELLGAYRGCVLLEHPFRSDTGTVAQYLRARFDKTVLMTNANGYGVMFQARRLPEAVTLSSSLGVELGTVGVPTTFLLGDPTRHMCVAGLDLGTSSALHHGVLVAPFWQTLFGVAESAAQPKRKLTDAFAIGHDYLRGSIGSWSYAQLQQGFSKTRSRKVIYPSEALKAEARLELTNLLSGATPPARGWTPHEVEGCHDRGVELIVADDPVGAGEAHVLDVGNPWSGVALEGFHATESWGAWSANRECRICIAVAPSWVKQRGRLRVRLSLHLFEGLSARCPVCRFSYHGETLALAFFRPAGQKSIDLSFTVTPAESCCFIDVSLSDIDSPYNVSGANDTRVIGIGLRQLEVLGLPPEQQAEKGTEGPEAAIWGVTAQPFALVAPGAAP